MFESIEFTQYFVPVVAAVCLIIGYIIKTSLPFITNKYIPLILVVIGVGANILNTGKFDLVVFIGGAFTGLVATGLHSTFKELVNGSSDEKTE